MSLVRWLFKHPLDWFVATLIIGGIYLTAVVVAYFRGAVLPSALHSSALFVLLISGISASVGNYVHWLDRRAGHRAGWVNDQAEARAHWQVDRLRALYPTQQLPILRAVGSDKDAASVSLPAQANRNRRDATVSRLSPDRVLGFLEGAMADREVTGEVYRAATDDEPSGDITSREAP